ncbi:MAG: hypothetical protein GY754_19145 [bacterium]|nr:hypothetical protein [bacterium]
MNETPNSSKKTERIYMGITLFLVTVTAWFSIGFIHADEHFQIIELVSYKFGQIDKAYLPWDFHSQIRSWMQPTIYYNIAKATRFLGITDPFITSYFFRLVSGILAWISLVMLYFTAKKWLKTGEEHSYLLKVMALTWYLPFLFVRTSSENLCASFFTAGLCAILYHTAPDERGEKEPTAPVSIAGGILLGLSFEFRFQAGFLIAGFLLWLLIISRASIKKLALICSGIFIVLGLSLLVDTWGYGTLTFPPFNYFKSNLIDGAAKSFGTAPFYGYLYLLLANPAAPLIAILMIALIITWIRHPKHVITWVTVPFILAHSLVGHKEARFMYPLGILATLFLVLAFSPHSGRPFSFVSYIWARRKSPLMKFFYIINFIYLLFLIFYPVKLAMNMQKYLYYTFNDRLEYYTENYGPYQVMSFYRPKEFIAHNLKDITEFEKVIADNKKTVYLLYMGPLLPDKAKLFEKRGTLEYATIPPRIRDYLFNEWPFKEKIRGIKGKNFNRSWVWLYRFPPAE